MEIKDYYNFIKRNWITIVAVPVVLAIATYFISISRAQVYQASSSIEVIRKQTVNQQQVSYYQFDDYYAYQAASAASDNIIGWISSAATVAEVYQRAGYEVPQASIMDLSNTFITNKQIGDSAVVDISYSDIDREKALNMISTASELMKERVESYNSIEESDVFSAQVGSPVIIEAPKMEELNTIIALFVGLIISITAASIREALK